MIVLSILSISIFLVVISYKNSSNAITIGSAIEILNDNILESRNSLITNKINSSDFVFSISSPQFYYHRDTLNISSQKRLKSAENLTISNIVPISSTSRGSANFTWENFSSNDVLFQVKAGKNIIDEKDNAEVVDLGEDIKTPTISISPINENQKYEFSIMDKADKLVSEKIVFFYFSQENLDGNDKNKVVLSKIEALDFFDNWLPLNSINLKIYSSPPKKKYYYGNTEYKRVIVTFKKDDETMSYEL